MALNIKNRQLNAFILNRVFFRLLVTVLLVVFGWLAGWYLQGHSISSWQESNYFTNPFRVAYLVFLLVEAVIITFLASRTAQVTDDAARNWYHMRLVMWETLLVLAVFSDCMLILPIGTTSAPRSIGIALLLIGLLLYTSAGASRRLELHLNPETLFPTHGIFTVIRFPETLAALFYAFGTALVFNAWAGLFIAFISIIIIAGFIIAQDKSLLNIHRSSWAEYQTHTKRLIPFIW